MAKIKRGEKVNVKELFVRDNSSIWQRIARTLRNMSTSISHSEVVESKEATLAFIEIVIGDAITMIYAYRKESDEFKQGIADIIVGNLERSKPGVANLAETYKGERKFISDMEATLQTLDASLLALKRNGLATGLSDKGFSNWSFADPEEAALMPSPPPLPLRDIDQ